jgi:NAD(P)-dependent dehydrogenase (short-subunit alcohol dehydrogenase family)
MKNVLITGASGNLGHASVRQFLNEGYRVIATVTPGKSLPFKVSGELDIMSADLSDEKAADDVIQKVIDKYKTLDAVLLLVGGWTGGRIGETDGSMLKRMYSLNFETAYYVARPAFVQMSRQESGGRIIFVGARPSLDTKAGRSSLAYGLSKSLIFKLSEYLNAEGAAKNVVSSVVVPSTIDTPSNRASMPDADFTTWVKPEEIASVMSFLVSDQAAAIREPVVKIYGRA